jgi:predicted CoA-binding protein
VSLDDRITDFLSGASYAVVGASSSRAKYGNKVFRCYLQNGRTAWPVNPREPEIEGQLAFPDLATLPGPVHGVSIITPPATTEQIVKQAAVLGLRRLWMQPGAESPAALALAEERGLSVIAGGPCILVTLGYSESAPLP